MHPKTKSPLSTIVLLFVFGKNVAEVSLKMQLSNIIHLHLQIFRCLFLNTWQTTLQ